MKAFASRLNRRGVLAVSGVLATIASVARSAPAPSSDPQEQRLHSDWAWRERYREENARDAARPAAERRCVFLGDSITQGWREKRPAFFTDHGFLGRGISGQTTPQMLVRFPFDVVELKPVAVHLLAATNDVAENTGPYDPAATKGWIAAMAALARAHGIAVVLGATPPAAEFPWRPGLGPAAKITALNAWMRGFAEEQGHVFADYAAVLDDGAGGMNPGLAYDGVHPTDAGYAAMEPVALAAVERALARG